MKELLGKLRTRAHVLADLSVNYVERQVLFCGCAVQRIYSDYGYDLMMSTFKPNGEIEEPFSSRSRRPTRYRCSRTKGLSPGS
jgi:hypothetical protein